MPPFFTRNDVCLKPAEVMSAVSLVVPTGVSSGTSPSLQKSSHNLAQLSSITLSVLTEGDPGLK